ncbi:MAG: thioesterase family protein [Spirochaetes bacterium]|nr:thioesterase family protein [Spirochaetota bacterium]
MPKVKLKKQKKYDFNYKTTIKVRDINYGGHLSNDSLVGLLHEARIDLLKQMGFGELNLGDQKTGIIMTDLVVNFRNQGYMHDEITIQSQIDEISSVGFRVFHQILKEETLIGLAEIGIVCFNYQDNQIADVPEVFLQTLEQFQKDC